ncbi:NAD(P)/FAD-dependent oxidoreductase [bacterium]|nr:NAD(P)/FAD-dependent oxidoreductase [bacterium]
MEPFDTVNIGRLLLKNRLLMAPVKTAFATFEGKVTTTLVEYYKRRAAGGVGAIIVESMFIDKRGKEHPKQLGIDSYELVEGLKWLTSAIHTEDTFAIAHLNHGGRAANPKAMGSTPEAPSAILCPSTGAIPQELTSDRVKQLVKEFAGAAGRAVEAGFDAIELQFGLGYLIHQFISKTTNQRTDEYGGNKLNRYRFALEVFDAVRETVGDTYPIIGRISASIDGSGNDINESIELAHLLENRGVSALHVASGSACDSPAWYYQHMRLPAKKNIDWATTIRRNINIPVIVAGRMGDPSLIRHAIMHGHVDAVALGRPLVVDPDFPDKMKRQVDESIVRCGGCLQGCLVGVKSGIGIGCIANPEIGHEGEFVPETKATLKIVVVGGGPAGVQAAITASRRNCQVVLFDAGTLGGQYNLAVIPPGKMEMKYPLNGMISQLNRRNISVRMNQMATADEIIAEQPDKIILATGSKPVIPGIPGLNDYLVSEDVLFGNEPVGKRVLVIGGGMVGMETAEYLVEHEHSVTIVEILEEVALDMEPITRKLILKRLAISTATILTSTQISRIDGSHVFVRNGSNENHLGEFDSVVIATGNKSNCELEDELRARGYKTERIGDAHKPGNIVNAVKEGFQISINL